MAKTYLYLCQYCSESKNSFLSVGYSRQKWVISYCVRSFQWKNPQHCLVVCEISTLYVASHHEEKNLQDVPNNNAGGDAEGMIPSAHVEAGELVFRPALASGLRTAPWKPLHAHGLWGGIPNSSSATTYMESGEDAIWSCSSPILLRRILRRFVHRLAFESKGSILLWDRITDLLFSGCYNN